MMKQFLIILFVFVFHVVDAQLNMPWRQLDNIDWVNFPTPYYNNYGDKNSPFYFANENETSININNSGTAHKFDDGTFIWALGLVSEYAKNINVYIENVDLNVGEYIYIYSPNNENYQEFSQIDGVYDRTIQSYPIESDTIIIEYQGYSSNIPQFEITAVNCGFLSLTSKNQFSANKNGKYGDSDDCEIDASCVDGIDDISQSVCRLVINGNQLATGVLVNNTAKDGTPYILSSAHAIPCSGFKSCSAMFNFEVPMCDKMPSRDYEVVNNVSLVYSSELRDVALYIMPNEPTSQMRTYYSGWDLSDNQQGRFVTIHHPSGDARKVSVAEEIKYKTYNADKTTCENIFDENNHWEIKKWVSGTTEGGSSGGGLWNDENKLIGCLTGGYSSCNLKSSDYYWRLNNNWISNNPNEKALSDYLDPINSGALSLDGAWLSNEKYELIFGIKKNSTLISEYLANNTGYIAGHNKLTTTAIAQSFGADGQKTTITNIAFNAYSVTSEHGANFTVFICNDNNGKPGNVIYTSEAIKNKNISKNNIFFYELPEAITIEDKFHIGINLYYGTAATDTLSFYYSLGNEIDGASFKVNNEWVSYKDLPNCNDINCNLYIGYKGYSSTEKKESILNEQTNDIFFKQNGNVIEFSNSKICDIYLYNINGRQIGKYSAQGAEYYKIDISLFPSGIYLIVVDINNKKNTYKILKY